MFAASKTASVSGGYQISRSLRFNSADSAYLDRTPASASNRTTFTISFWTKITKLDVRNMLFEIFGAPNDNDYFSIEVSSTNQLGFGGYLTTWRYTNQVFRDPSAWYHIVVAVDTTQATANNRARLYVNGSEVTSFAALSNPTQNSNTAVDSTFQHKIGTGTGGYYNGYMTEYYLIDGQQLTPSSFGETNAQTGVWQPKAYSGSYGTNGFYLNFSDNSNTTAATLGKDYSGNGNNWTPNNFSVTAGSGNDSLVDSPTSYGTTDTGVGGEIRGNYCTMNPLDKSSNITFSNGNLDGTASTGWALGRATFGMSSGKWYWEVVMTSGVYLITGIAKQSATLSGYLGSDANGWGYYSNDGNKYNNGSSSAYGATWGANAVIGVAFDADAGTLTFYKNGTSQGTAYTGLTSGPYFPATSIDTSVFITTNFGQRPFAYTAPSGYKALCTQNLPTPTIGATTATQAGKYFNPVLYTGNSGVNVVTGMGFQPDMLWQKDRTSTGNNVIDDAVRGINKVLITNDTLAELTGTTYLTSFDSDGFSMNTASPAFNFSGRSYVAWGWKANGSGSTNTAGQITSTVSANTTSGFSIVTFTTDGTTKTVGHGLGVKPSLIIAKVRNGVGSWIVMTDIINGSMQYGTLNTLNAFASIGYSAPTSTVFQYNDNNGNTQVAYCFAPISGYSAFGTYTGNGSADGPFVYLGFRPAYLLIKFTNGTTNWMVLDNPRSSYFNVAKNKLYPNTSDAEDTSAENGVDLVSNGFKIRTSNNKSNDPGATYIYMAFAENPFKYSLAR